MIGARARTCSFIARSIIIIESEGTTPVEMSLPLVILCSLHAWRSREVRPREAFSLWRRSANQPERFARYIRLRRGRCILGNNQSVAAFRACQPHFSSSSPKTGGRPIRPAEIQREMAAWTVGGRFRRSSFSLGHANEQDAATRGGRRCEWRTVRRRCWREG